MELIPRWNRSLLWRHF